jgi:hypothetical protein
VALIQDLETLDPAITVWNVPDFPRHWKPALAQLRTRRGRSEAVFVLLAPQMDAEEAAKATRLDANGIVSEDMTGKDGPNRLLAILRRYGSLQDKRTHTRHPVGPEDRVGLAFIHPTARSLVTGRVTEVSLKGLTFLPDRAQSCEEMRMGEDIACCSLRVGESIVALACRLIRPGLDLGLEFVTFEEGGHELVRTYIQGRPERSLRAALAAGRTSQDRPAGSPSA